MNMARSNKYFFIFFLIICSCANEKNNSISNHSDSLNNNLIIFSPHNSKYYSDTLNATKFYIGYTHYVNIYSPTERFDTTYLDTLKITRTNKDSISFAMNEIKY